VGPPRAGPCGRYSLTRRIQVEDDLPRSALLDLKERIDQQIPDRHRIVTDLLIARRLELAQLQRLRRFAGDRCIYLASPPLRQQIAADKESRAHAVTARKVDNGTAVRSACLGEHYADQNLVELSGRALERRVD
jgi:hypothetical protein